MTYAFQTPDKLCFVLDLMNGMYLVVEILLVRNLKVYFYFRLMY